MAEKIQGRLVRTGVVVMESFQIEFEDENGPDAKRFAANPREVVEQLLKSEGIAVNGIHVVESSQVAAGGKVLQQKTAYHVVHPPAEKSNTIVIN